MSLVQIKMFLVDSHGLFLRGVKCRNYELCSHVKTVILNNYFLLSVNFNFEPINFVPEVLKNSSILCITSIA